MKYYIEVAKASKEIYSHFQDPRLFRFDSSYMKDSVQIEKYLQSLKRFHDRYEEFNEAVGIYKFGSLVEEVFIANVSRTINKKLKKLFTPYDLRFTDTDDANAYNGLLRGKLKEWLEKPSNVEFLYKLCLVYYWIMYIAVEDTLLVSYVNTSQQRKDLEKNVQNSESELRKAILDLNCKLIEFFEGLHVIDKKARDSLMTINNLRNDYLHPKMKSPQDLKKDSLKALNPMCELARHRLSVLNFYDIVDGKLVIKPQYR